MTPPQPSDSPDPNGQPLELPDDLASLGERLRASRPVPSSAVRHRILDRLTTIPAEGPNGGRTGTLIALFAATGTFLLAVGALVTFL